MSIKTTQDEELDRLFGNLTRKPHMRAEQEATPHEGQPATYVPFSFNGADVFDETDTMDVLIYIPDEMVKIVKARAVLSFREFFAPATAASSGGGSTSGSSSASSTASGGSSSPTSTGGGAHNHRMFEGLGAVPGITSDHGYRARLSNGSDYDMILKVATGSALDMYTRDSASDHSHSVTVPDHSHGIAHTHSTPAHAHGLTYGVFKEPMPASWSVELRLYSWSGTAWTLVASITSGLTSQIEDVDLSDYILTPGKYRISLKSAAGQPNDGRLGCDIAGHVVGAIQALTSG